MKRMPHKAIVIETTDSAFTALEVTGGVGSPEIRRWVSQPLPAEGLNVPWLKQLWQQKKFSTHKVIWLVPEKLIRYKTLSFANLPADQLAAAVKVELENTGCAADIWRIIGTQAQERQLRVRLAFIADLQLKQSLALLTQAGLEVQWSGFGSRGLQNFIFFHQAFWEVETTRYAYLYVAEERTEYGVVSEAEMLYRRTLKLGKRDFEGNDAVTAQNDLLDELRLSFASSKDVGQEATDQVWLFGDNLALLLNLETVLSQAGFEVILPQKTNLGGDCLNEAVPHLAPLIGLALDELGWNSRKSLRIFSLEQQKQQMTQGQIDWVLKFALVGVFFLLGGWFWTQAHVCETQKMRHWLATQAPKLIRLKQAETTIQNNKRQISYLERWSEQKGRELEFLLRLQQHLPEETFITDINIENGKVKTLAGTTPLVSVLMTRLSEDPILSELQIKDNIIKTETGSESFQLEAKNATKAAQKQ